MARYWVGGNQNWDGTAGNKWSATDGGAGGASEPDNTQDVFFTALSGAAVVAITTSTRSCRNFDCTGFTGTLSNTANLNVGSAGGGGGSFVLSPFMNFNMSVGTISFLATTDNGGAGWTVDFAGKSFGAIQLSFNGPGGKWVLASGFTHTGTLSHTAGHLDTNNKNCTWLAYSGTGAVAKTLTLGSSQITVTNSTSAWVSNGTNFTINAGTSTITMSNPQGQFGPGTGQVFNNVVFPGLNATSASLTGTGITWTCANLTIIGNAIATANFVTAPLNVIVTNLLTITGFSPAVRLLVQSSITGTLRTFTAANVALSNVDFMDITGAGAATWTGTFLGDCGGNSGITFTPSTSQTWSGTTNNYSDATKWTSRVPLPQDDVTIVHTVGTMSIDVMRLGRNINFTGSTATVTRTNIAMWVFGSLTFAAGMTWNSQNTGNNITLAGRGAYTITTAGQVINNRSTNPGGITVDCFGGTYTQTDHLTMNNNVANGNGMTVASGGYNTGNFNMTINAQGGQFTVSSGASVTLGTSIVSIGFNNAANVFWQALAGSIISAADSTIILATSSTFARTFTGGSNAYGTLTYMVENSPGAMLIGGSNTFKNLNVAPGRALTHAAGTTNTTLNNFNVNGQKFDYVYMPNVNGNFLSIPDPAWLAGATELDLRVAVIVDDYTPASSQVLAAQTPNGAAADASFRFVILATGAPRIEISDGVAYNVINGSATVPASWTNGVTLAMYRLTWRGSDRQVQFFTKTSTPENFQADMASHTGWTVNSTGTVPGATAALLDSTQPLTFNTYANGAAPLAAKWYGAWVSNVIGGSPQADIRVSAKVFGASSFIESSPNAATVTVNGVEAQQGDGRVTLGSTTASNFSLIVPPTTNVDCLVISRSTLLNNDAYAGGRSVDGGNNSVNPGWRFAQGAGARMLAALL